MRNFLKQNLLATLVCLFAMAAFASATTITRPYGASDYAGGTKAVGAKVNAEFANIVAWLNGGNISSDNIATSGVATANIASFAVTTDKINTAAVTLSKLAASSLAVTSTSSLWTSTTAANTNAGVTVTNLTTTFTATGRPVTVSLEANPAEYLQLGSLIFGSYVQAIDSVASGAINGLFFVRDSSTTAHYQWFAAATAQGFVRYPCSAFSYTETPAAGTYTYTVKVSTNLPSTTTITVANCRLVVREW